MATPQPDVFRSRAALLGHLTGHYKYIEDFISAGGPVSEAKDLLARLDHRHATYLESHELCISAINPEEHQELQVSHGANQLQHLEVADKLTAYIKEQDKLEEDDEVSSLADTQVSRRKTRTQTTRSSRKSSSQASRARSEKMIEARVQAEVARKKMEQIKRIQEMRKRKQELEAEANARRQELEQDAARRAQDIADEIELTETQHKLQELELEVSVREREQVREELGSDYESDEEREDVTQKRRPKAKIGFQNEVDQQADMKGILQAISRQQVDHPPPLTATVQHQTNHDQGYHPPTPLFASPAANIASTPSQGPCVTHNTPSAGQHNALQQPSPDISDSSDMFYRAMREIHLPRPEQQGFDGSPKNYRAFISSFKSNIADKVSDPTLKLTYLIQHCSGDAKKLIKDCVLLPPISAYTTAIEKLEKRFGQNHLIARAYIDDITKETKIGDNDVNALVAFSDELNNCQTVLSQLSFTSDLNSSETLKHIYRRLPSHIQGKWVEKSADIMEQKNREATFADMAVFVERRARVANTMFGRDFAASNKTKYQDRISKDKKNKPVATTLATTNELASNASSNSTKFKTKTSTAVGTETALKRNCAYCDEDTHNIYRCFKFKKLSLDEKLEAVKKAHLCFRCLKTGHGASDCDKNCVRCDRRHNVLLHDYSRDAKNSSQASESAKPEAKAQASDSEKIVTSTTVSANRCSSLGILPVRILANGKEVQTMALIDNGSNTTLVERKIIDELGIAGTPSPVQVNTLNGKASHQHQLMCDLQVSSKDRSEIITIEALTVPSIPIRPNRCSDAYKKWPHLADIDMPTEEDGSVGLLIGTDCPEMQWSIEDRHGGRKEPMARKTLLGWIVLGPVSNGPQEVCANAMQVDTLQEQLNHVWSADFNDVKNVDPVMSVEDRTALKLMQESVKLVDGKFQLGIPWRANPESSLPNNRSVAESRLRMLKKRFIDNPVLAKDYTKTLETYIADGHARQVSPSESSEQHQWFLPHHAVFKKSDPTKCRVVFDCAAQYKGLSLNDAILQGPNYLNNLAGVLVRFRKEPVAVVGDIKAMFHQCFVLPDDQRFIRFLWWPQGDTSQPAKVHAMTVHLFGAKSSPSVACYCLRKIATDNEADFSEEAIETLRRSFYMDDMLKSVGTVDQAKKLVPEMTSLLSKGGFKLTKYISTHRDVIDTVPEEERAKSLQTLAIDDNCLPQESALGLQWNVEDDFFTYSVQLENKPATRRGLLATTASLYDPLGLVSPVLLVPKLIQQDLCRLELDWDDNVPEEKVKQIIAWKADAPRLSSLKIQRCFQRGPSSTSDRELHVFSDASEFAYGAAAYLKVMSEDGISVSLVMGKSRVAPIKAISIPRLELTAALVAAKLSKFLKDESDYGDLQVFFWTDSMTVLRYIQNLSTRFKVFVAHRVQQIQDLSEVSSWNYVPTDLNPADLASRGILPSENDKLQFWLQGPSFLKDNQEYSRRFEEPLSQEQELEVRTCFAMDFIADSSTFIHHYSSLVRLLKAICWMRKFFKFLSKNEVSKSVTVADISSSKEGLIKFVQKEMFDKELNALKRSLKLPNSSSIRSLCPIIKDGLLCVGGRLDRASEDVVKNPIILPAHHLTTLIIRDCHERNAHVGSNHTLSVLRRNYYITKGYSQVKSVLNDCIPCKKVQGQTMQQKMSDLPKERVATSNPPFTFVGVDYFGPMNVKFRRGSTKRYGCIFTCLVTRAVHIEIAHSLDSDSFLMALHRFIARRGKPQQLWSDNGTNFVAANKELADEVQAINNRKVQDEMLVEAVEWRFNPPHAAHMGGVWERLIRSVKTLLKHLVQDRLLTDEELLSFMCEVEKIMNDRPLTRMGTDPRDDTPLTPNHLLLLRGNSCSSSMENNYVRRRWQLIQDIANKFYKRFIVEYLPDLQARSKWRESKENLQVNDVVLVAEEDVPRGQWPLGLVEDIERSGDGLVRAAKVRCGKTTKRRPINKLVFLEHHE